MSKSRHLSNTWNAIKKSNLILAVTGIGADRAKTLLRFMHRELCVERTMIEVFDCCDFWQTSTQAAV